MAIRVSLLMEHGRQAWSETHYLVAENDIQNAVGGAQILAGKRAALLGFDAFVFAIRLSDPSNVGLSILLNLVPPIQGRKFRVSNGFVTLFVSDNVGLANLAVQVDGGGFLGARFHRSRPMLAAPPNGLIQSNAGVTVVQLGQVTDWSDNFNAYSAMLTDGGWGFRVTNEGALFPIQGVTGGNGVPIALTVNNAFSPVAQTLVHVRGLRVHPTTRVPLAGKWRTLAPVIGPLPGTNSIGLANSESWPAAAAYMGPGTIQTAAAALIPYLKFDVGTGITRKRGGNLELPRGRSRTRLSLGF